MADKLGVNRETIRQILVEDLGKRKVASQFVPHALSDDQRHKRVQYTKDIIKTAWFFTMIPQLNAKVLNGSHQHHQKVKKFVFKSQK